mmetsp:Transcript_29899/g.34087  ORF Transcript_29899/g.34087 Transcript_29899/m.34087 type:complete len:138 (+) Transcript_29899:624-1037(+)
MIGKYMPTHISKMSMPTYNITSLDPKATSVIANAEAAKTPTAIASTLIRATRMENSDDPAIQDTIKVENIKPKGISVPSLERFFNAGVHMKTNIYIDPSNRDEIIPHNKISRDLIVTVYAFRSPSYQADWRLSSPDF